MGAVEERGEALVGDGRRCSSVARIVATCSSRARRTSSFSNAARRRRPHQAEAAREVLARNSAVTIVASVPAPALMLAAERLDRARQLLAERSPAPRVSVRAVSDAAPVRPLGILRAAGADDELHLDERHLALLGDDDPEPVLERHARDGRELELAAAARRRRARQEQHRDGPHGFAPPACGIERHDRLLLGTRYCPTTRRTSSALTASHSASTRDSAR
jgi:hypothetical protein